MHLAALNNHQWTVLDLYQTHALYSINSITILDGYKSLLWRGTLDHFGALSVFCCEQCGFNSDPGGWII